MIIVYTQPRCMQCLATFKRLDDRGLTYDVHELDGDDDPMREVLRAAGHTQLPVVRILNRAGHLINEWSGFRPEKIASVPHD